MASPRKSALRSRLLSLSRGFLPSRIFLTALELGVFPALAARPMTGSGAAEFLKTDPRGTEILLDALSGLGLLGKEGGEYSVPREVRELLDPEEGGGGFSDGARLWTACSSLTDIVRGGGPAAIPWTEGSAMEFSCAMKHYAEETAERIADAIEYDGGGRMLDLGGGAGCHAFALLKRDPSLKAVLFDRDESALRIAAADAARQNLGERITLRKGDFLADELGDGYDLVLLSSVLCLFGKEEVRMILEKSRASLSDGGRVAVVDRFVDDSGTTPVEAAVFSVHMLLTTRKGRSHSIRNVTDWMKQAGFHEIRRMPMGASAVLVGEKS